MEKAYCDLQQNEYHNYEYDNSIYKESGIDLLTSEIVLKKIQKEIFLSPRKTFF